MLKVLICCAGGMSSSFASKRMQKEIEEKGLKDQVVFDFSPFPSTHADNCEEKLNAYDVAMCCPHLLANVKKVSSDHPNITCALYIMPPKMYGTLFFDELYQDAQDILKEFQKTKQNPFNFEGEENALRIDRMNSYRRTYPGKLD